MSIRVKLIDLLGNVLGASWANPVKTALFGTGGGDYHSPTSFTATQSSANTITLSGVGPTITNGSQFRAVRSFTASGALIGEWRPSEEFPFSYDAVTAILTVGNADFGGAAYLDVELHAEHRAFSSTESAYQQYRVNPEHAWTQESTLVDVTDETDSTIYYYVDWDNYRYGGFQLALSCDAGTVTATCEATFQDDGTAQASCSYEDITNEFFGVASLVAAAGSASDIWIVDTALPAKYVRIKIVYNTTANTGDATVFMRAIY